MFSTTSLSSKNHDSTVIPNHSKSLYVTVRKENLIYRLGNQMFIYAAMLGIAKAQMRLPFVEDGKHLGQTFKLNYVNSNINTSRWELKHVGRYATFDPDLFHLPNINISLRGYFQSWKYFSHIQEEIRREFTFLPHITEQSVEFYKKLSESYKNRTFVGVHVRRGDLLDAKNQKRGSVVANQSYFLKAFSVMRSILPKRPLFIVGSDDLEWCKLNLNFTDVTVLSPNSPMIHLAIFANTSHMVMTTGTYGWWAAWLANGVTIYYNKFPAPGLVFERGFNKDDYYPPTWIGLGD
ncbi:galactoside alpha-(1,2)-fucosyltransferase 2-like [Physella acuta]|uniref:galactoside alpha-(1,2)-fucosyltransferase 2-like n=1 Tax=Physella acuta TaxID=109671 RepID=UPI0027DCDAF6|nr:galactoside alpha-(1,2)-fucosyltransferase 2-like [Physella acuta]